MNGICMEGRKAKHSSASALWYTPISIIESAKKVLGSIDLDPASDAFGNERIQAAAFFTKEQDGLKQNWAVNDAVTLFVNPPGGILNRQSIPVLFWSKLMDLRNQNKLKHAIFIGFSMEILQTTQAKGFDSACFYTICIPNKRIKFDFQSAQKRSPTHGNAIIYVHGNTEEDLRYKFRNEFQRHGAILKPFDI